MRYSMDGSSSTIQSETPCAEPHAGCLWGLGVKDLRLPDYASVTKGRSAGKDVS